MKKWFSKKLEVKPTAQVTGVSEDLLAQIAGGASKGGCHTVRTYSSLGLAAL